MCIFALSINSHPKYKLVLASNRDEFFNRETAFAHYWESSNILAGKDLKMGGTWLGINRDKLAILTNYRNPLVVDMSYKSRGMLVLDYLNKEVSINNWRKNIEKEKYNPFNIILGPLHNLHYYSNIKKELTKLDDGIHILSNGFLNEAWPKAEKLRKLFVEVLAPRSPKGEVTNSLSAKKSPLGDLGAIHSKLIKIMQDEEKFPVNQLPDTNIPKEMEHFLSSIFINSEKYGTRTTTIITIDNQNNTEFTEISYNNKKEVINKFYEKFLAFS